jgi:phosphomevalonate kinase
MTCEVTRRFRAPGKVLLVGEYAVLDGAPAVVAAVDRGVACAASPSFGGRHIETPDGDVRFVAAALDVAGAPGGVYRFAAWNPPPTGTKPGLGGSAAATVAALFAGLALRGGPGGPEALLASAIAVHRAVQGSGSGVDVTAAVYGGVLRFERGSARPLPPCNPVLGWSGRSAATGPRIERYLAWPDRGAFVRDMTAIVEDFSEHPVEALRDARRCLARMAAAADVDWATPALDAIAALAESHGGGAKPSGSGGGDCAVALFDDPEAEGAFVRACARAGHVVVDANVASAVRELSPEES